MSLCNEFNKILVIIALPMMGGYSDLMIVIVYGSWGRFLTPGGLVEKGQKERDERGGLDQGLSTSGYQLLYDIIDMV